MPSVEVFIFPVVDQKFLFWACFRPKIPLLGKLGPKNQNCQFKLTIQVDQFECAKFFFAFSVLD